MASTRSTLEEVSENLAESMGIRNDDAATPSLSPVPNQRDIGRRPTTELGEVSIDCITADPDQPRSDFSDESLDRLAESLRQSGQITPIHVRWSEALGTWVIVAGERRWRAAQRAGFEKIKCVFRNDEISAGETLALQLVENLLREDLKPSEEARGYSRLMELRGYTGKQVAAALSIPESKVSRSLALLRLPEDLLADVDAGRLAARTACELSRLNGHDQQRRLARRAIGERLTHNDIAGIVRQKRGKRKPKRRGTQLRFAAEGGWTVQIVGPGGVSYHHVLAALETTIDEVKARIDGGVQLF